MITANETLRVFAAGYLAGFIRDWLEDVAAQMTSCPSPRDQLLAEARIALDRARERQGQVGEKDALRRALRLIVEAEDLGVGVRG